MLSNQTNSGHRFRDVITSEAELRAVLGEPVDKAVAKVVRTIDDYSRRFIANSPFILIGSAGATSGILPSLTSNPSFGT